MANPAADLQEWARKRAARVQDPSPRTPWRSTQFNTADILERQLQQDGHKVWGWVIYRCTYGSDEHWAAFMECLRRNTHDALERMNGLDMLESLHYQVVADRDLFDGAHPSNVLEHFAQWTVTAPMRDQGVEARQFETSKRYHYCIHVDEEALYSILAESDGISGPGFVNLVCLNILGGMRPEHTTDRDERDLCWMRIRFKYLFPTWYCSMREGWRDYYRIPPEVASP